MKLKSPQANWKINVSGRTYPLTGESLFIGSDKLCDVSLEAQGIASFHCEISYKENHWQFNCEDLGTSILMNGGEVLVRGEIRNGDIIRIGEIDLEFLEPPVLLTEVPQFAAFDDFEDIETTKVTQAIAETIQVKRIEVINYHNGHIQDVNYLPLKHGSYSIGSGGRGKTHIPFSTINDSPLFTIDQRRIQFHPHSELTPSGDWNTLSLGEAIFLTKGAEQVSLRIVQHSIKWKPNRWSYDKDFWKVAAVALLFIIIPFLALQFIELPQIEPKKQDVVVIYKLKDTDSQEEKNAPSENPSEAIAEAAAAPDGSMSPEVTPEEAAPEAVVAEAASNPEPVRAEPVPAKAEVVAVAAVRPTAAPKAKPILKPVAIKKPAPVEVALKPAPEKVNEPEKEIIKEAQETVAEAKVEKVEEAPKKTYSFNSGLTKSLVGPATKLKLEAPQAKLAGSSATFTTGTRAKNSLLGKMNKGPGKLSEESEGTSLSSSSRGVASKSGFDTSSIDKNTVIRGSMDPEVLRRILREYIPQFRHCYQQELIYKSEKIKGVLDLDFTINAQGKTSRYTVRTKDARFSQRGIDCMGNVLAIIDFPKPKGGGIVDVTQPLNFFAEK